MAEEIKRKAPATTPTTPTVITSPVAAKLPSLDDSPRYREAVAKVTRIQHEIARLELVVARAQQQRQDYINNRNARINAVANGAAAASVMVPPADAQHEHAIRELRLNRQALDLAQQELAQIENAVKDEVTAPFSPHFRPKARAAAIAWLAYARAMSDLDAVSEELTNRGLLGYGGCDRRDLPAFPGGNPTHPDSSFALIARDLIASGLIDPVTDAALLAGLAVAPPRPVYVEPAPPMVKPKEPFSMKRMLQRLGAID